MNKSETVFIDCFRQAFNQLPIKADSIEVKYFDSGVNCQHAVASIDFFGDHCGTVVMCINENDKPEVKQIFLDAFLPGETLEDCIVFSEILNIYSGKLISEFKKIGKNFNIHPPKENFIFLEKGIGMYHAKVISSGKNEINYYFYLRNSGNV